MTLLTLVRHGQTDWNLNRRIQGSTNIPLNEAGRVDALTAAAELANGTFHTIYSSPLMRAHETAQIIAAQLGLAPPRLIHGMREREFGAAEGMQIDKYMETYGDWMAKVPGAETSHDVWDRAIATLSTIARDARLRSAPMAESVIVVTHGGVIRSLLHHASGGTIPAEGEFVPNGSVHSFELSPGILRLLEYPQK